MSARRPVGVFYVVRSVTGGVRSFLADPTSRALLVLTWGLIVLGSIFYRVVEDLSWVDACYFTIVTLTTVGFGDIAPQTTAGKLFTAVYLLVGIGILVSFVTAVAGHVIRSAPPARRTDEPG